MPLRWRLTFDEPYDIATEPGITKAVHCRNFRPGAGAYDNTWRDETTGLVMLAPSFTKRDWHDNMKALSTFRYEPTRWKRSRRSSLDLIESFTTIKPAGEAPHLIELMVAAAIVVILKLVDAYDNIVWALESNWSLATDQGWALYFSNLDDELIRKRNWLYLQWANIGLHIGQGGICKVYRYGEDMSAEPTLVHEFELCPPAEMSGRGSWLVFIPVPHYGLLCYHSAYAPKHPLFGGSGSVGTARGHLVPWTGWKDDGGYKHLFSESPIRIGLNPYQQYHFGVSVLTYPSSGTYTDAVFDPGYKPSSDPTTLAGILLPTDEQTVTATLRTADNSAAWEAGTDRKARVKLALSTSDTKHTPFVQGYGAVWDAVMAERTTTPIEARVTKLELTEDSQGRTEGSVEFLATDSDMRAIADRGDATWLLESSADEGVTWDAEGAGLAKQFRLGLKRYGYGTTETMYVGECKLFDMMERLRESHMLAQTAFDGMTVGDAINVVLNMGGFGRIVVPEPINSRAVPVSKSGDTWRYAVKPGDTGEEILQKLLVLGRRQNQEWIAVHDPDTWEWSITPRARDTATKWTLTTDSDDHSVEARVVRYASLSMEPLPPECNVLRVIGVTSPDPQGTKIVAYAANQDSIDTPESDDYLGRVVLAEFAAEEALTQGEVNMLARKIEARAMHHSWRASVDCQQYVGGLAPNCCVDILDRDDSVLATMWIKRRTLTVTAADGVSGYREQVTYELESIWEDPI